MNMKRLFLLPMILLALVQPVFAAAPPPTVLSDLITKGPWIDSRAYKTLALADAAAVTAGKLLVIPTVYTTVPATLNAAVKILPGGKLNGNGTVHIPNQFEGADGCFGASQAVTGIKEPRPDMWQVNTLPGITPMATAWQSAINCALASRGEIVASGTYLIGSTLVASGNIAGSIATYGNLKIRTRGHNNTTLLSSVANAPALWIKSGQYDIDGLTIDTLDGTVNPGGIRLGDNANGTFVAQSSMSNVKVIHCYKSLQLEYVWDSTFTRVTLQNGVSGGTFLEVTPVTAENTNTLTFVGCHFENIANGKLVSVIGSAEPVHELNFIATHFETVNRNTTALYLEYVAHATFTGCVFTQNGSDAASGRVPIIHLKGTYNANFYGGTVATTAASTASKLIKIEGSVTASFNNMYFADSSNGETIAGLIDTTAGLTGAGVEFRSVQLNDQARVKLSSANVIGNTTARFKQEYLSGNRLATYFDNNGSYSATSWSTPPKSVMGVYGSMSRGIPVNITNGGYADFDIENTVMANGPAMIAVTVDTPAATAGLFFKRATSVFAVSALADIVASATPAAGKFGVSAPSNSVLRIHNNYGSSRDVTLFVMGAQ